MPPLKFLPRYPYRSCRRNPSHCGRTWRKAGVWAEVGDNRVEKTRGLRGDDGACQQETKDYDINNY